MVGIGKISFSRKIAILNRGLTLITQIARFRFLGLSMNLVNKYVQCCEYEHGRLHRDWEVAPTEKGNKRSLFGDRSYRRNVM